MQKNFVLNFLVDFFKFDFFFNGLKKYSHFGGREGRKNFFLFQISTILIFMGINIVAEKFDKFIYVLIYVVFMFSPVVSSMVRRLHDVGKSGLVLPVSFLLSAISFVCSVFLFSDLHFVLGLMTIFSFVIMLYPLFLFLKGSKNNDNKYTESVSHPLKHFLMMFSFILIFIFFLYVFGYMIGHLEVLPQEGALTTEEITKIDSLVEEYQKLK